MPADRTTPGYELQKRRAAQRSAAQSKAGRDIGPIPPVADPARKVEGCRSFRRFCEIYFPHTFRLAWSTDHRRMIEKIEAAVLEGGLFALAMPRGSGKTSLAEVAVIWALSTAARSFVVLIGSDEGAAAQLLESVKTELLSNPLLAADFPEVVFPIARLEGIAHRAAGQLCEGRPTHVTWGADEIVLPTVRGSRASGSMLRSTGLTGRIRGMKFKRPDGSGDMRPDFVVIDDPQTDESARSPGQCAQRERIIGGAILGLAGPTKKIAGVMPCTVIQPGDLAERILDRTKHPRWQGERTRLLNSFPDGTGPAESASATPTSKLWDQYADLRNASLAAGNGGKEATEFYRANREQMDKGAEASWPVRFNDDELSAVQHGMNLWIADPAGMLAEYQNDPQVEKLGGKMMSAEAIAAKVNGLARGVVPLGHELVTAFVDVQGELLYWLVAAWRADFTGTVIDYGAHPDQKRRHFRLADARRTLSEAYPGKRLEGRIYAGLESLCGELVARRFRREDGAELSLGRGLVDAGWGKSTDTVYQFCRQDPAGRVFLPSHGKGVGASSVPWDQFRRQDGETIGHHWMLPSLKARRAVRHVLIDTNYWKSAVHLALNVAMGDRGCLSLFGRRGEDHRMLAEHMVAEYSVRTHGRSREVDEWKPRPGNPDNHLLDGVVGAAAAASMLGARLQLADAAAARAAPRRRARAQATYL